MGAPATGLGIDVIEIERIERALERRPRLRERLFTPAELAYADERARPGRHLAARFAAKEAVIKALPGPGHRPLADRDRRRRASHRAPAAAPPSAPPPGARCSVSLTHSRDTAAAVALASA